MMTNPKNDFHKRVEEALKNETLQIALDNNASRRRQARTTSFASLADDLENYRDRAQKIREEVIDNLDAYLDSFVKRATQNGMIIHSAKTSEEATQIVIKIAQKNHAELIVKAKSMVSEEIHLNHSLEKLGLRVVESDLGEYIVQLRGEPPSHIITPAVHLRRQDVAALFNREFGMPLTDDIRIMNDVARRELRDVFLNADVGISGVNFAVVETGTLCILTNEGNGRMTTTVPRIHIALLGIERLLPTLSDLALFLELLPRHATGQKITSYVNLLQAPRLPGDQDGPQERHVILVDNRRNDIATSKMKEMLACIRCGACLNACPVFQEIGGHAYNSPYPGPIGSILSPQLFGLAEYGHLAKASTLCGACMDACPVKIDFPSLLLETRHQYVQTVPQPWVMNFIMRGFAFVAKRPSLYSLALRSAGAAASLLPDEGKWIKSLPAPLNRWTNSRHFPQPARQPFRTLWKTQPQSPESNNMTRTENPAQNKPLSETREKKIDNISELTDQFANELTALGGEFIFCNTTNIQANLLDLLKQSTAQILVWDDLHIQLPFDIASWLKAESYTTLSAHLLLRDPARKEGISWISKADTGITGAYAAIANTGTVILPSGEKHSQLASLLPSHHIVILPIERIFPDFQTWIASGGSELIKANQCVSLVSGPSRTADIEMTLTIGVHGPAKVTVLGLDQNSNQVSTHKHK
jgi:L-lactate dehydrogenase complex protein LldF